MAGVEFVRADGRTEPRLNFDDAKPLGHEVLALIRCREDPHPALENIQLALDGLYHSEKPIDKFTVESINAQFQEDTEGLERADMPSRTVYRNRKDVVGWLAGKATLRQLKGFCEWNVMRHARQQRALHAVVPALQQDTLERSARLTGGGYFPRAARRLFRETVWGVTDIVALDSFEAGGSGAIGAFYGDGNSYRLELANLFTDTATFSGVSDELRETAFHEYMHGVGFLQNRGFYDGIDRSRDGVGWATWVEEAFVTHAAKMAMSGDEKRWATLQPEPRGTDDYGLEREVMALLANGDSRYKIKVDKLTAAFFAPEDDPQHVRWEVEYILRHNAAKHFPQWESAAYDVICERYGRAPMHLRPKLMSGWLKKICAHLQIPPPVEGELA